ncbi:MAG: PIN domain-containing protein [Coraliomargarita sp.]
MRILFDTNVLLDIALSRGAFADSSINAYEKVRASGTLPLIAPHSLATFYYMVVRAHNRATALTAVQDILATAEIADFSHEAALQSVQLEMPDFEDAMITSAALQSGAELILTRNETDFKHSPIPVQSPEAYLKASAT